MRLFPRQRGRLKIRRNFGTFIIFRDPKHAMEQVKKIRLKAILPISLTDYAYLCFLLQGSQT